MKAIVYTKHGAPDVLSLEEIEIPRIKEDELLVKVHAASVNALDSHMMRAFPFGSFMDKFSKPKMNIPGVDLAGTVESVGSAVSKFKVGDEVFGSGYGAFAEYAVVSEKNLLLKSPSVTFEEAAAVPVASLTALQGLRDYGKIQKGQKVLINGAGGGVGTYAVQIAKSFDTEVTAVCSTRNLETVRSIGADYVVDYTKENIIQSGKKYDLILAVNGYHSIQSYRSVLNPKGTFVMAGASKDKMLQALSQSFLLAPIISITGKQKMRFFIAKINNKDLSVMSKLMEEGKVKSVIDKRYPLSEVPEAIRYLEEWHLRGKIIINI